MAYRLVAIRLIALQILLLYSGSFAAQPLVIAELQAKRQIAEAESARVGAERDLAAWKLAQLKKLRERGHASWQEVAEQQVTLRAAEALKEAAQQYLQAVLKSQAHVAKMNLPRQERESESIRLYMPGSARLVAWLSTDVASLDLSRRHLENLAVQHRALSSIDLSLAQAAIKKAGQAVEVYERLETDADLLSRARIRLRGARAEYKGAMANKAMAGIVARRMAIVHESMDENQDTREPARSLAQVGTRFVDATSDFGLSRLVDTMATDEARANGQLALLKHRRDGALSRIDALEKLSAYSLADPGELDQAQQARMDLDLQIQQARFVLNVHRQVAGKYETAFKSGSTASIEPAASMDCEDVRVADANVVRHSLDLQQRKLQAAAQRAAIKAQGDYLVERRQRVERIVEQARAPKELEHLNHQVQQVERELAIVDHELLFLVRERQRFHAQVQSQRSGQYQLVQVGDGALIRREQFELGEALIAAIAFVGNSELFHQVPAMHPYIESTIMFDCLAKLSTQSVAPATELFSHCDFGYDDKLHRRDLWRDARKTTTFFGLRLATDGIKYPANAFCYLPYELQAVHPGVRWQPRDYARAANSCGFRTFNPYETYPFRSCGQSILSYRCGFPTRSSFPYRSDYLYRTAFPARSSPTSGWSGGFSSTWWQNDRCYD